jgi:hypothetical protein
VSAQESSVSIAPEALPTLYSFAQRERVVSNLVFVNSTTLTATFTVIGSNVDLGDLEIDLDLRPFVLHRSSVTPCWGNTEKSIAGPPAVVNAARLIIMADCA